MMIMAPATIPRSRGNKNNRTCSSIISVTAFLAVLFDCSTVSSGDGNHDGSVIFGAEAFELKTLSITRGVVEPDGFFAEGDLLRLRDQESNECVYDGGQILLKNPSSLSQNNRYYGTGNLMLESAGITIDRINNERCGVEVNGKRYALQLRSYSDDSDKNKTEIVTRAIINQSDFLLAGYASTLASVQNPLANANKKLVITAGASSTSAHADKKYAFGLLPPARNYFLNAFDALSKVGAKTIGYLYEDDYSSCKPEFATNYGFEVVYVFEIGENKTYEVYDEAAQNASKINPDAMITCTRLHPHFWGQAMRKYDWNPKGQVMFGNVPLDEALGTDAQHMMTVSSWVETLPPIPDAVSGWTPEEFAIEFELAAHRPPDYRQVSQSAAISVLVQAIEMVGSINDTDAVVEYMQNNTFDTVYAKVSFDENGQNNAPVLLLQFDGDNVAQVALPKSLNRGFEIVYPMPSWKKRDCTVLTECLESNGECMDDGTCSCPSGLIQIGIGETAACKKLPAEDMTYIGTTFLYVGYAYVGVQCITSAFFVVWTIWNRKSDTVRASQPIFLHLVSFGCFILSTSIIPATIQGDYRYFQDPVTLQPTHVFNDSILNVDIACMAFPWLFGLGFGIVFSALFAKTYRTREILMSATEFRRKQVQLRDVLYIIVLVLSVEFVILLVWQLVDPLLWDREIIRASEDGLPLQSSGQCTAEQGLIFWLIFISFNVCLLLYALILCYKTWDYPSEFAESRWITACVISYIQILLLAVPILVIVNGDNDVFFFVKASIVFLMSISVTFFIFVPKVVALRTSREDGATLGQITHQFVRNHKRTNSHDELQMDSSIHISGFDPRGSSSVQFIQQSGVFSDDDPSKSSITADIVPSAFNVAFDEAKGKSDGAKGK